MIAGAGRVCITPRPGVDLTGYWHRVQPSVGVRDDLYARGLYLEEAGERLLWLHCDLLGFDREQARRLSEAAADELNMEKRQIVISATHTHSGPATQSLRGCGEVDEGYLRELDKRVLQAAREAASHPTQVTLWFAEATCAIGVDRRTRCPGLENSPLAHTDPVVPVIALKRPDGTFCAVVVNYAIHNVAHSSQNRLISADLAGAAAAFLRKQLPGGPVTLFTNGAAGNVNPQEKSDDSQAAERFGRELGAAAAEAAAGARQYEAPGLASRMDTVLLPLSVLTAEQVNQRYEEIIHLCRGGPLNVFGAVEDWRTETLALLERGQAPQHVALDLQVFRIGPACFAAVPAEVFSRMADELRAAHGPHTYVLGYANGNVGYLPHRDIYAEGGYEVDVAFTVYANFMIAPGGFERVRDMAIKLLRGLPGRLEEQNCS